VVEREGVECVEEIRMGCRDVCEYFLGQRGEESESLSSLGCGRNGCPVCMECVDKYADFIRRQEQMEVGISVSSKSIVFLEPIKVDSKDIGWRAIAVIEDGMFKVLKKKRKV
jgi:hypothetical protein